MNQDAFVKEFGTGVSFREFERALVFKEQYEKEIDAHRKWLRPYGSDRLKKWEDLLDQNQEAAITEACTREFLANNIDRVEPAEDVASGGPDFRCFQKQQHFYVEATCMGESVVTAKTGLSPRRTGGASQFKPLTQAVLNKCCSKAAQCGGLDAACLLAIGTLHSLGGRVLAGKPYVEEILTGETIPTFPYDSDTGRVNIEEGHLTTDLHNAAFLWPKNGSPLDIEHARKSIAGLLLCPFGCDPTEPKGVLHPAPARPFDRSLLPNVPFCRLDREYATGEFGVRWV